MTTTEEPYLKPAGTDRLAPYYDLIARLGMRERHLKGRVIALARLGPGRRMLDLGCGTGTLVLLARRRHPGATVVGVDGDPVILGIARRKAERAGIAVQLDEGMAYALPYADGSFDAVVSTLTFHHLTLDRQEGALAEIRRVLRAGGRLVVADLTRPHNRLMRWAQRLHARVERHEGASDASHHARRMTMLEALLTRNGWRSVALAERSMSAFGTIALHALTRPDEARTGDTPSRPADGPSCGCGEESCRHTALPRTP